MKTYRLRAGIIAVFVLALSLAGTTGLTAQTAQATFNPQDDVTGKKEIAVFSLGYQGWSIPQETLGSIDAGMRRVFADIGRFTVIGYSQRFTQGGMSQFIDLLKRAKQENFVMPEEYQFGEAFLTKAEFNRLVGSFIVAVPVVTSFSSSFNYKNSRYETAISADVTFLDMAEGGTVLAVAQVETSGTSKDSQRDSIASAVNSIPGELEFKVRSIEAFQLDTRILSVSGSEIRLQLGENMGIKKGDEFAIVEKRSLEGFDDSREVGLVVIKDVGPEISTGSVLYTSTKANKNTKLHEIPRRGFDIDGYIKSLPVKTGGSTLVPGIRGTMSRGFYGLRPYASVQIPLSMIGILSFVQIIPVNAIIGAEYRIPVGRLGIAPYAGVGVSYFHLTTPWGGYDSDFISHVGFQACVRVDALISRDIRVFVDFGLESWLNTTGSSWYPGYGGAGISVGATYKL